jgi:hypothetical protein
MPHLLLSVFQFLLLFAFANFAAAQENAVGEVVFVSGEVQLQPATEAHSVQAGDVVRQGQELITKANGYIYIKTRDNGFISLRPNSALQFEVYQYSPDKPQDSRFKSNLKYGVMRSVSGIGAQSARDKYRLNTPVAAIGIRGTDFTVYATSDITRAAVTSGGIVMSGFNDGCTPGGMGPCNGGQIAELFAQQKGMLLQLRRGESRPALLDRQSSNLQPDTMSPPLPNEKPGKKAATEQSPAVDLAGDQAIIVRQGVALREQLNQAAIPVPLPPQQVFWGRWLSIAGDSPAGESQLDMLLKTDKKLIGLNGIFGLVRDQQTAMAFPSAGIYSFALHSHESYIMSDGNAVAARIENPSLNVDFNQQRFDTRFRVATDLQQVDIKSNGSVLRDGSLVSDQFGSPASVTGALANGGQQAGFLYQQRINDRQTAVGATYWTK